jgi:hypothetical protein
MHKARGMSGSAIEEKQNTPYERCSVTLVIGSRISLGLTHATEMRVSRIR